MSGEEPLGKKGIESSDTEFTTAAVGTIVEEAITELQRDVSEDFSAVGAGTFEICTAEKAKKFETSEEERFRFRVPPAWISPKLKNPFAREAESKVLDWFAAIGCEPDELRKASKFDIAGYVGFAFPYLSREHTTLIAKYLSLWLLWDDVKVETLEDTWKISADNIISGQRPEGMTRFDEGWWQLIQEFAGRRSQRWIEELCKAMEVWYGYAVKEAKVKKKQ